MLIRTVFALGLLSILFLNGFDGGKPVVDLAWGDTWECDEYYIAYGDRCGSNSDECGAFCFYAECIVCSDGYHDYFTEECDGGGDCDDDGNNCEPEVCWDVWSHDERHGESPCVTWLWHLDEDPDGARVENFNSPNIGPALIFGLVSDPDAVDGAGACNAGVIATPLKSDLVDPTGVEVEVGSVPIEIVGGYQDRAVMDISDVPGLVVTPGDVGAPRLLGVNKITDRQFRLAVGGYGTNRVEYRYWAYSGFVPSLIRVPFVILSGVVEIIGTRGVHSFQVRMVDADENVSGWSNVVHQLVGLDVLEVGPLPGLRVPATPTPMPEPPDGAVRPAKPMIDSVVQEPVVADTVKVTLAGVYSGVEYRWWPHSGFGPVSSSPYYEWTGVVPDSSRSFVLVGIGIIGAPEPSVSLLQTFDFQVRLASTQTVDGEPLVVYSEPSQAVVVQVWSGPNWEW